MFLVSCDLIRPCDKRSCDFMGEGSYYKSPHSQFVDHKHCGSRDKNFPANTVILPQMQDIRYDIYPFASAIIILGQTV